MKFRELAATLSKVFGEHDIDARQVMVEPKEIESQGWMDQIVEVNCQDESLVLKFEEALVATVEELAATGDLSYDHPEGTRAKSSFTLFPGDNLKEEQIRIAFQKAWKNASAYTIEHSISLLVNDMLTALPFGLDLLTPTLNSNRVSMRPTQTNLAVNANLARTAITDAYMEAIAVVLQENILEQLKAGTFKDVATETTGLGSNRHTSVLKMMILDSREIANRGKIFALLQQPAQRKQLLGKVQQQVAQSLQGNSSYRSLALLDLIEKSVARASAVSQAHFPCLSKALSNSQDLELTYKIVPSATAEESIHAQRALSTLLDTLSASCTALGIQVNTAKNTQDQSLTSFSIVLPRTQLISAIPEHFQTQFITRFTATYQEACRSSLSLSLNPSSNSSSQILPEVSNKTNQERYDALVGQEADRWNPLKKGLLQEHVADVDLRKEIRILIDQMLVENNFFCPLKQDIIDKSSYVITEFDTGAHVKKQVLSYFDSHTIKEWIKKNPINPLNRKELLMKDIKDASGHDKEISSFLRKLETYFRHTPPSNLSLEHFKQAFESYLPKEARPAPVSPSNQVPKAAAQAGFFNSQSSAETSLFKRHFANKAGQKLDVSLVMIETDISRELKDVHPGTRDKTKEQTVVEFAIKVGDCVIRSKRDGAVFISSAASLPIISTIPIDPIVIGSDDKALKEVLGLSETKSRGFALKAVECLGGLQKLPGFIRNGLRSKNSYLTEDGDELDFKTHSEVDEYCSNSKYLMDQNDGLDWLWLKLIDRSFWLKNGFFPHDSTHKPGSHGCPFGDPKVTGSFPLKY
ncbi:hypothetical protein BN59_01477 [Legionella massiliensis]|uniref:Uncharacterized protein n=1 Tax=Legionella massiliensis TaxID=1034943 RepID=A0A078KRW2_9GAMM|nr:hypothetical protein [Legionella massiliensis]CDZ77195.1 hypothetical protein BN59_01477 [Legionella massiliensis]CEE12933.1 hypothetical protein BN1094_01477 [Legionella massiliensis]